MSNERHLYTKLTPERGGGVLSELRRWLDGGNCCPNLGTSLLGLDWSCFVPREFPNEAEVASRINPPEFIYYAFSIIDVLATLMLRPKFSTPLLGRLEFSCSLKRRELEDTLYLELEVIPERGEIDLDSGLIALMFVLPEILTGKHLAIGDVDFQPGDRCLMHLAYPGRMIAAESHYLRNRPVDRWPQVTLNLSPTNELRRRAAVVLDFLLSFEPIEGKLN